jgi:hypothetical protein
VVVVVVVVVVVLVVGHRAGKKAGHMVRLVMERVTREQVIRSERVRGPERPRPHRFPHKAQ